MTNTTTRLLRANAQLHRRWASEASQRQSASPGPIANTVRDVLAEIKVKREVPI